MNKKVYTIDVGNIPSSEVDAYMEKVIRKLKSVPYISQDEMVKLGYFVPHKLTRWQRFKRWCKSVIETLAIAGSFGGF